MLLKIFYELDSCLPGDTPNPGIGFDSFISLSLHISLFSSSSNLKRPFAYLKKFAPYFLFPYPKKFDYPVN